MMAFGLLLPQSTLTGGARITRAAGPFSGFRQALSGRGPGMTAKGSAPAKMDRSHHHAAGANR